ncbi:MAG: hypothetical protein MJ218_01630 [Opitutales bacterium]|nr:hypothetical protein [Opitutales bacterium]
MFHRINLLLALSIALGIQTPCYGLYVMVRSGFGELKGDDIGQFLSRSQTGIVPTTIGPKNFIIGRSNDNNYMSTSGSFKYKDHKNLSVALGGRFDVFDIGSLGLEVEILGAYANLDTKARPVHEYDNAFSFPIPDFVARVYYRQPNPRPARQTRYSTRLLYLKNQRIAGAQVNAYWEQYLLDYLSVGIGGGIGGAYVCTKFTTMEWFVTNITGALWRGYIENHRKYVHSGSLLYNFTLFVRAEKFETLFEVGYRHIGLHQMFGAKCYGYAIPKLANLHSDQIYLGVGRTF